MAISQELLDILACPKCKGDIYLNDAKDGLICDQCKLLYEIREAVKPQSYKVIKLGSEVHLNSRTIFSAGFQASQPSGLPALSHSLTTEAQGRIQQ